MMFLYPVIDVPFFIFQSFSVSDDTFNSDNPTNLVFYLSQQDAYLSTSPTEASLFGPAGKCFEVEVVINFQSSL